MMDKKVSQAERIALEVKSGGEGGGANAKAAIAEKLKKLKEKGGAAFISLPGQAAVAPVGQGTRGLGDNKRKRQGGKAPNKNKAGKNTKPRAAAPPS